MQEQAVADGSNPSRRKANGSENAGGPPINDGLESLLAEQPLAPSVLEPAEKASRSRGEDTPDPQVITTDTVELPDGSLAECIEDPEDPTRSRFVVYKDGTVSYAEKLAYEDRILLPPPREHKLLWHIRLPQQASAYGTVTELVSRLEKLFQGVVADEHVPVLANFVLVTWVADRLPISPYLLVIGLPQSGKTTLLKLLSLVCRRPLYVTDATPAAIYDVYARLTPTLLLDDADTYGHQPGLRRILRSGIHSDAVALRRHRVLQAYGAKVISCSSPPDDPALTSRCIQIPMGEKRNALPLLSLSYSPFPELAAELQSQLLQFRLERYWTIAPLDYYRFRFRPRSYDLLSCLAAPTAEDEERCERLFEFFCEHDSLTREALSPAESAVLSVLHYVCEYEVGQSQESIGIKDLTRLVNKVQREAGLGWQVTERKVGAILSSFGLRHRRRTWEGWYVWLTRSDRQRIRELALSYGVESTVKRAAEKDPVYPFFSGTRGHVTRHE